MQKGHAAFQGNRPHGGLEMRMLLRVSIPAEAGNTAAKAGALGSTIEKILADIKPEAAYFLADDDGQRSGSIIFDMKDSSEIPSIAEPWFLAFNATISLRPVMNPQDLAKAGAAIAEAAREYGK
jgi:hypothetical protein